MNFEDITSSQFLLSLGYVTIIASVLTLFLTQIMKFFLGKWKIVTKDMNATKKDIILARTGRIIALVVYSGLYIANEFYLSHAVVFDEALVTGLLSGGALTLTISKGLYTTLHQYQAKRSVFNGTNSHAAEKPSEISFADEELIKQKAGDISERKPAKKWVLTQKDEAN